MKLQYFAQAKKQLLTHKTVIPLTIYICTSMKSTIKYYSQRTTPGGHFSLLIP